MTEKTTTPAVPNRLALVANHLLSEGYKMEPVALGSPGKWGLIGIKADESNIVVSETWVAWYAAGNWEGVDRYPDAIVACSHEDQGAYTEAVVLAVREFGGC